MTTQYNNPSTQNKWKKFAGLGLALTALLALSACGKPASSDTACKAVRFSDVGWSDITATTGVAKFVLTGLGYEPKDQVLSVPVTYSSMKNKDIDVFLGNWMPTMENDRKAYIDDKSVEVVRANLEGGKYTLAVPEYLAEKGLKDFKDIVKFEKELKGKIYGIEAGNDGNRLISDMIKADKFGLGKFKLEESSEQGMLSQVEKFAATKEAIVFLGWAPHPMNVKYKLVYLTGGDDVFGANFGEAKIYTNVRANYMTECANVGKFSGEPLLHGRYGKRSDEHHRRQEDGADGRGQGLSQGASRSPRCLAQGCDDDRWQARPRCC